MLVLVSILSLLFFFLMISHARDDRHFAELAHFDVVIIRFFSFDCCLAIRIVPRRVIGFIWGLLSWNGRACA